MIRPASLRVKFALLALLNLAVLSLTVVLFIRHQLGQEFQSFLMATAREKIVGVSRQLTLDLSSADPSQRNALLTRYSASYGIEFRLFDSDGARLAGPEAPVPAEVARRLTPPPGLPRSLSGPGPPPFLITAGDPPLYWVGVRMLLPSPDMRNPARATLVLVSPTLLTNPFFFDWEPWLAILLTALLVTSLCWLPLVGGLTRDIRRMTEATAAVAEGQFDVRLETRRSDELGRLGGSINQMTARLRDYVDGQKRFLGDVAHELRSPLGRMQVALGILERRSGQPEQVYVRDLQEDVEILSGLTTELLTFARSELRRDPVSISPVPLRQIIEHAVQMESPQDMAVTVSLDGDLTALGEETLLTRAMANLIRNATLHAAAGGAIDILGHASGDQIVVTVSDRGPGVPPDALEKIFTPFFRLDSARNRRKGGTGLGLALVRHHVEACGGTVQARNRPGGGLEMAITLRSAR